MRSLLCLLLLFVACGSPSDSERNPQIAAMIEAESNVGKAEALSRIHTHWQEAKFHRPQIVDCARLAVLAKHNHGVIAEAARFVGQTGSNTGLYKDIAGVASAADHECPKLSEILELAVLCRSESGHIVDLARFALIADTDEERERLDTAIAYRRENATYASVEEALAAEH